jgi:hypothetical protein
MAPLPPLTIVDPYAWERSSVTRLALGDLVSASQLAANEEGRPAEWIVPPAGDHVPNPPNDYVVSDRSLWDLEMLPTGPLVSRILGPIFDLDDTSGF